MINVIKIKVTQSQRNDKVLKWLELKSDIVHIGLLVENVRQNQS